MQWCVKDTGGESSETCVTLPCSLCEGPLNYIPTRVLTWLTRPGASRESGAYIYYMTTWTFCLCMRTLTFMHAHTYVDLWLVSNLCHVVRFPILSHLLCWLVSRSVHLLCCSSTAFPTVTRETRNLKHDGHSSIMKEHSAYSSLLKRSRLHCCSTFKNSTTLNEANLYVFILTERFFKSSETIGQ